MCASAPACRTSRTVRSDLIAGSASAGRAEHRREGPPACSHNGISPRRDRRTWRRSWQASGRVPSWRPVCPLPGRSTSRGLPRFDRVDSTHGMRHPDPAPRSCESPLPERLLLRLADLSKLFTRPTWQNVLLLVAGAILAPGKRTVTAALRILGREQETDFPIYHGVLNKAVWSSRAVAGWLLRLLVATFVGVDATVVIGIDDTIERRWGRKINARGIYRDPVRSSKGHFVKTSGLRWLSAQLLVHIPWAGRIMGLPFLTVLAPSKRFYAGTPRAPKTLLDWARQAALQIHRWLPGRRIVIVGDTGFAAIEFLAAVRGYVSVVTRLRLDANLYAPAPPKRPRRGRPPIKGKRLAKLNQVLHDPRTVWQRHTVALWYGRTN